MAQEHNIKVDEEVVNQKYSCSQCSFTSSNMNEFKNHQIKSHKKEPHNWMVEDIRIVFSCGECDEVFTRKSTLEIHKNEIHNGDDTSQAFTLVELDELIKLHEEEMAPTGEELDWMLRTEIKMERKILASKYFPSK